MPRLILVALLLLAALPVRAERLRIVADIAPVHALVAAVAGERAEPVLLLPPGASPHHYSMRPSEAGALAGADLVFWVGPALTPWLERPLAALSGAGRVIALSETPGLTRWPLRSATGPGVVPGSLDPHLWLDPENALAWLEAIEAAMARADPENAPAYARNAAGARTEIAALERELHALFAPLPARPYLASHDSWQYFERRFSLPESAAILLSEAERPAPAHLYALQRLVAAQGIDCVLAEPPLDEALIRTIFAGRNMPRILLADPLGAALAPGPGLYAELLRDTGRAVAGCLGG